jgi:hypothetical protein
VLKAGLRVAKTNSPEEKAFDAIVDDAILVPHFEFQATIRDAGMNFN